MILYPNKSQTLILPAGQVLSLTNPSGSSGRVVRLALSPGGGNSQSTTIIAGADLSFGPYAQTERFEIFCTTGTVTYTSAVPDPSLLQLDTEATAALALKVSHSLAVAENDFLVGAPTPFGSWIKKTLAQTKAILGLSGIVPAGAAENDFICAGADPFAWAKKTLAEVKTILGLGTAAYTAATAYDPAGTAAGKIASSISNDDTTHAPDGNSVFDALAGKETAGAAAAIIAASISDSDVTHCPDGNSVFDGLALKLDKASAAPVILAITEKTPVNAVAASRILTFTGQPTEKEKVTIGATIYEFHTAIGAGVKASGALTFAGNAEDNETVTIDGQVYTFANAIAEPGAKATGHLNFAANPSENEVVVIGPNTYRFRDQIASIAAFKTLTFTAVAANTETVTVDTTVYTFVTALTESKGTGVLTASANPTDGNRVEIDGVEYTFRDAISAAFDVHIGISAAASLLNLVEAITAGANVGTDYGTGTTEHTTVTAAEGAGDTVDVTAKLVGLAGNVTSVGYGGVLTFAAATLTGGLDPVLNQILVEAAATDEIDNLVAAAMTGVGAGTKFSTGQPQLANVGLTKTDAANILATAVVAGTAGNSIAIDETCAQVAWTADAKFLGGGYAEAVANDVILDAVDATVAVTNLIAAIMAAGIEGTNYGTGTVEHPSVTAANTLDVLDVTAKAYGDAGNAIATTTTAGGGSAWADITLVGGEDPDTSYIVLIGATKEDSIDNLVSAITDGGGIGTGEGTLYGTGTAPHPSVTATRALAVMTAEALAVGDAGNLIAVSKAAGLDATWAGAGFLTLGDDAQEAYDVLISAVNTEGSIDNLVAAIAGTGDGTTCGNGTDAHPLVTAVKTDTDKVTATAIIKGGTTGNAIATESTVTLATWPSGFMIGGVDGTTGVANETCADGTNLYHCLAINGVADANWRKVTLASL